VYRARSSDVRGNGVDHGIHGNWIAFASKQIYASTIVLGPRMTRHMRFGQKNGDRVSLWLKVVGHTLQLGGLTQHHQIGAHFVDRVGVQRRATRDVDQEVRA
jgi:hypothetical protein